MDAYAGNRDSIHELALEASAIAAPVRSLADARTGRAPPPSCCDAHNGSPTRHPEGQGLARYPRTLGAPPSCGPEPAGRGVGVRVLPTSSELGVRRRQVSIKNGEAFERSYRSNRSDADFDDAVSFPGGTVNRSARTIAPGSGTMTRTLKVQPGTFRTVGTVNYVPVLAPSTRSPPGPSAPPAANEETTPDA